MDGKICTGCGMEKSVDEYHFSGRGPGKRVARCKSCVKVKAALWYQENRARHREKNEAWKAANRERWLGYANEYRRENIDKARDYEREYSRNRYRRDPELVRSRTRSWEIRNPDAMRQKNLRRRVRRSKVAAVHFTRERMLDRFSMFGHVCYVCGASWSQVDHVKPLILGGPDMLSNIRPICSSCNARKGAKWYGVAGLSDLVTWIRSATLAARTGTRRPLAQLKRS